MLSKTKLNNKDIENIVERWEKRRESKIGKRCRKRNLEEIIKACLTCKREEKTCVDIRVCQLDGEMIEESGVEKEKNENEEPVPEKYLGELVPQSACQLDCVVNEEPRVEKEKNENVGPVPEKHLGGLVLPPISFWIERIVRSWDCKECGEKIQCSMNKDCEECVEGIGEEELHQTLLGLDVVGLFPAIK